ncbi:MAG: ATP-binding cassette domain-containing protein [Ignavibacterium sp.]
MSILSFNDVSFSYSNSKVFSNINFEMNEAEFVFLIGKSGSGKSTFLKLIYMDLIPQNGFIQFANYDSIGIKQRAIPKLRQKIGVVFQDFKLLKDRNVSDNLSFVLNVVNTSSKKMKRKINDVLSNVGLLHKKNNFPDELSGGEQQRLAIARAIINEPILVIADEPTGNLDPETSTEILDIFKNINSQGTAVLFATHNYELIKKFPSRVVKLENNKLVNMILKNKL